MDAETSATITAWVAEAFGATDNEFRRVSRGNEEMAELITAVASNASDDEIGEEAADVAILLHLICGRRGRDLNAEIDRKMQKNRGRKWAVDATGCGYHIKTAGASSWNTRVTTQAPADLLERVAVPLVFYDSPDRSRRLNALADALERNGGRVSVQNEARLIADLRVFASIPAGGVEEAEALKHDLERQMKIANAECNEAQRLREALTDARLFVELVHAHWSNWHPEDSEQIAEAADCIKQIDAALSTQGASS